MKHNTRLNLLLALGLLLLSALACGGEDEVTPTLSPAMETTPPEPAAGVQILEATFAHGLSEEMQPMEPGADFAPDETVYLSLKIKGRPKEGLVTARFYWHDEFIAEADVDLSDVNSGLLFSVGENTYAGYTLTHVQPFPISEEYRAEVFYDGQPLGTYPFHIAPSPEAIPSQIKQVTLARGAAEDYNPIEPTTTFAPDEDVYLVGRGDLGLATWLQAEWYVSGQLDEAGTRSLTLEENALDTGFVFSYLPAGDWPTGEHTVVLTMNDVEVGRYSFTIGQPSSTVPFDETAFGETFPLPEDADLVPVVEGFDLGFTTDLIEPEVFDFYAARLRDQGWQQQAPTEALVTLPHQIWRNDGTELLIEIEGLDEQSRTIVWVQVR